MPILFICYRFELHNVLKMICAHEEVNLSDRSTKPKCLLTGAYKSLLDYSKLPFELSNCPQHPSDRSTRLTNFEMIMSMTVLKTALVVDIHFRKTDLYLNSRYFAKWIAFWFSCLNSVKWTMLYFWFCFTTSLPMIVMICVDAFSTLFYVSFSKTSKYCPIVERQHSFSTILSYFWLIAISTTAGSPRLPKCFLCNPLHVFWLNPYIRPTDYYLECNINHCLTSTIFKVVTA